MKKPAKISIFVLVMIIAMCSTRPVSAENPNFVVPTHFYTRDGTWFNRTSTFVAKHIAISAKSKYENMEFYVQRLSFDVRYLYDQVPDNEANPLPLDSSQFLIKKVNVQMFLIVILTKFQASEVIKPVSIESNDDVRTRHFYRAARDEIRVDKLQYNNDLRAIEPHEIGTVIFTERYHDEDEDKEYPEAMTVYADNGQLECRDISESDLNRIEYIIDVYTPTLQNLIPFYTINDPTFTHVPSVFISANVVLTIDEIELSENTKLYFVWCNNNYPLFKPDELDIFKVDEVFFLIVLHRKYDHSDLTVDITPLTRNAYNPKETYLCVYRPVTGDISAKDFYFTIFPSSYASPHTIQTQTEPVDSDSFGSPLFVRGEWCSKPLVLGFLGSVEREKGRGFSTIDVHNSYPRLEKFVTATTPTHPEMIEIQNDLKQFQCDRWGRWVPPLKKLEKFINLLRYIDSNTTPIASKKLTNAIKAMVALYDKMINEMQTYGEVNVENFVEYQMQRLVLVDYFAI